MKTLLDANVLIALVDRAHEHHRSASKWAAPADAESLLTCPTVENATLRYLIRTDVPAGDAHAILESVRDDQRFSFVAETTPMHRESLAGVIGYRQITDVSLCQIARRSRAKLATFDRGLGILRPTDTLVISVR